MHQLEQAASFFGPVVAGYILAALSSSYDLVTNELKNELKEVWVMTKSYEYESGK